MGKLESEPSDQAPITHFSHPHPLHLLTLQTANCSACKLDAAGSVYTCTACSFFLHPKCYQLPQVIKHTFDQKHTLNLCPKPVYPEGLFRCDACGTQGGGFSYHCSPCGVDLHTTCASLPEQFIHQCHHHPLSLTFSAPYPKNTFSCDICKRISSKSWIYRCAACEFDAHISCVATVVPSPGPIPQPLTRSIIPAQTSNFVGPSNNMANYCVPRPVNLATGHAQNLFVEMPQTSSVGYGNLNPPGYAAPRPVNNLNQPAGYGAAGPVYSLNQPAGYGGARPVNVLRDQLMVGVANGIASGIAQSTTQAILEGFLAGGDGGVNQGDMTGMSAGGAAVDGGLCYDGGYSVTDEAYSGGDGSY